MVIAEMSLTSYITIAWYKIILKNNDKVLEE